MPLLTIIYWASSMWMNYAKGFKFYSQDHVTSATV